MSKTVFMFSGQGGQTTGMGADLHGAFPTVREIYAQASEILGYRVKDLTQPQLALPEYAQPAVMTLSYACYRLMVEKNVRVDIMTGYGLGELTALAAAEVIRFDDALRLARLRGRLTQSAVRPGEGSLCIILGISAIQCEQLCASVNGYAACAMYNSSEQIVIGGDTDAVNAVQRRALEMGASNTLLNEGMTPIHTEKMRPAAEPMSEALSLMPFHSGHTAVLSNLDGMPYGDDDAAKRICAQMVSPIRWDRVCERLFDMGIERYVELGPGKILATIVGRMNRAVKTHCVEDSSGLLKFLIGG
ncbi:MAG: ACP S-malonyltransferase [Oscillospiraceae bacterium]|nr:ACP S-malonyltransferase [Oscillospiraceae bacterium]